MPYTVQQLANLAGVSVRTLHYYDEIELLKPARVERNGYRYYEEPELLKLQQILFFRELDFPLEDIQRILSSSSFDMRAALRDQRKLIELKKNRLSKLVQTIDKTLKKINKEITMDDTELYGDFSKDELDRYTKEARERWGHTDAFKQSQERVKKMGKEGLKRVMEKSEKLNKELAQQMTEGENPSSGNVQNLIAKHYDDLRAFYEPNLQLYRGLAEMYIADERFKKNYENVAIGLAQFMHDAMIYYVETEETKK
jgi:DNA-binding transcriptional MerR regulator